MRERKVGRVWRVVKRARDELDLVCTKQDEIHDERLEELGCEAIIPASHVRRAQDC